MHVDVCYPLIDTNQANKEITKDSNYHSHYEKSSQILSEDPKQTSLEGEMGKTKTSNVLPSGPLKNKTSCK